MRFRTVPFRLAGCRREYQKNIEENAHSSFQNRRSEPRFHRPCLYVIDAPMRTKSTRKMLYVMVATPTGPTGQGGIDRMMGVLKQQLQQRAGDDISVRFVASRGSGPVALSFFHMLGFCMTMLLARLRGRCDLVHINLSSFGSTYRKIVIAAFAQALGIPYVLHLHGSEYRSFWRNDNRFVSRCIRHMFENAAHVIVLGHIWRDFVAARAPAAQPRIVIVPNATAIPALQTIGGGETCHILFLGRLGQRKGVPELCEALNQLADHGGWRMTIAGDGDIEETRETLARNGLGARVTLPGWVGQSAVTHLIASADILVLPSYNENLPVSVIEAMAAGLAVIATPVGAVEDIITDGETGLLVKPGDASALAAAIRRLLDDPNLRKSLGEAAMAVHRERLELSAFAETICNIWKASRD